MEALTREAALSRLRADNPQAQPDDVALYLEAYLEYQKAAANIAEHGPIIIHPRSGAPIDNPYCRVRSAAVESMRKVLKRNKTLTNVTGLWAEE
jgi:phage terminase small subunit